MKIKLLSLEFLPRGQKGWSSEQLHFGNRVTFISGNNQAGKTPLMASIAFCLGMPYQFRQDIVEQCAAVHLEIEINEVQYQIERQIDTPYNFAVFSGDGELHTFENEKDFSNFLFDRIDFPHPELTSTSNERAPLYTSHLMSSFYIDQLLGWSTTYWSQSRYIKNQSEEMLRLILGLSPRFPYSQKEELNREKKRLASVTVEISDRGRIARDLHTAFGSPDMANLPKLHERRDGLRRGLEILKLRLPSNDEALAAIDIELAASQRDLADTSSKLYSIGAKRRSLNQISDEVQAESETLSLNDAALNKFRSFCQVENCGMFSTSERSYGRSLLYLLDQLKDLKLGVSELEKQEAQINAESEKINARIAELTTAKTKLLSRSDLFAVGDLIGSASSELVDIEMQIASAARVNVQNAQLAQLSIKRGEIQDRIEDLNVSAGRTLTGETRTAISESMNKWLLLIGFDSAKAAASLDENFKLYLGSESYKAFKGSTLTRIILAFHAAVLEYCLDRGNHLGFLLMDCPKQQELEPSDLKRYLEALAKLADSSTSKFQICFSSSEFEFDNSESDVEWRPAFNDGQVDRYLSPTLD
ncbi:MAG: hypothetical protein EOP05_00270 [Proteobacteria bacterium]|nr:MAG: hypothetical protein EOP05_00270 [Pseudomonadota bacterium]